MSHRLLAGGLGLLAGVACADRAEPARAAAERPADVPPDTLVATAPGGAEIWWTLARRDSAGGRPCVERAVEIRRGAARTPVPLLYTTLAPEILDDTTARARLSTHCVPGDSYLVDLRTGRPVKERS
jgi:hypothetical protein